MLLEREAKRRRNRDGPSWLTVLVLEYQGGWLIGNWCSVDEIDLFVGIGEDSIKSEIAGQ